jgi:aminoglycoside N3'-acetyltransferase
MKLWKTEGKSQLYLATRRLISQRKRDALKRQIITSRKQLSSVYLMLYGRHSARELVEQLRNRVPDDFEILMIHSAYDRLLPMYQGGPQDLVNELLAFCGTNRTLAMPAFSLGGRLYDKGQYFRTHAFDVKRTPSEMGLLTEVFRRTPGVTRSLHPTHSVCAIGPLAQDITATHHLGTTRTGRGTPFDTMAQRRTAIVGLGIEYWRCITQSHTAEDMLGDEFPVKFEKEPIPTVLIDWQGNKTQYSLTIPQSSKLVHNTLLRSLLSEEELITWKFHGTAMWVAAASRVTERLLEAAKKGITIWW